MGKQDALEGAKLSQNGEPAKQKTGKELATEIVLAARKALPEGIPANSPYAKASRDAMLNDAALRQIMIAPLLTEDDLRFVIEHERLKIASAPHASKPADAKPQLPSPPVPMQPAPPPRRKIRGLPESPSGKWRVTNEQPKTVAVEGQLTSMRAGSIIERRHYTDAGLQGMIEQGLKLEAFDETADDWE